MIVIIFLALGNGGFRWDLGCMGAGIELSEGNSKVFLRESAYMFRTVLGDQVKKSILIIQLSFNNFLGNNY